MNGFFNMDSPVMRFLSRVCDLMILNLLCLICCIPIITIGASITALYSVTLKMVKGEETYIVKGFFHALKQNFKISTIMTLFNNIYKNNDKIQANVKFYDEWFEELSLCRYVTR